MTQEILGAKTCVPCQGGIPPLDPEKANELLISTPNWVLNEDATRISQSIIFKDFKEAMKFVNQVATLAEEEGHHPDISIHWNKVDLLLYTHKINGLHENDFIMAAKFNRVRGL